MNKKARLGLGSAIVAAAMGVMLLPAVSASATEGFSCPDGTDTIDVPYAFSADNVPELAGTVCVQTGTTAFEQVNVTDGWRAEVKSSGSNDRTEVRFSNADTRDRVELRYEAGKTEIKN
ncbi:MAG TPA: hypothetical protein VGP36_01830 [Mycobacteriales bacterium]|nr:hypothetical protein [Mycobacteriales bacterium]